MEEWILLVDLEDREKTLGHLSVKRERHGERFVSFDYAIGSSVNVREWLHKRGENGREENTSESTDSHVVLASNY